jgi:hypothetical protein
LAKRHRRRTSRQQRGFAAMLTVDGRSSTPAKRLWVRARSALGRFPRPKCAAFRAKRSAR